MAEGSWTPCLPRALKLATGSRQKYLEIHTQARSQSAEREKQKELQELSRKGKIELWGNFRAIQNIAKSLWLD